MIPFVLSLFSLSTAAPPVTGWASAVPATVKVRPGAIPQGSPSIQLEAAQGECEGFQIVAPPKLEVRLEAAALTGPGKPIGVKRYREAFVEVGTPSNARGAKGLWPDPLIPMDDPDFAGLEPWKKTPEAPYVAYVEVCIPESQRPGSYRGQAKLTAQGRTAQTLEVALEVLPFALPSTSSLTNSFGLSLYSIAKGHGLTPDSPEARSLLRRYAETLLRHRVSPHGMSMEPIPARLEGGRLKLDFTALEREQGDFLSGRAFPNGARFTSIELKEPLKLPDGARATDYWQQVRDHFKARGWTAQPFYYAKDEPKPKDYPVVMAQAERLHTAHGVPVLVTSYYEPSMAKAADILCPNLNCFFERSGGQTCKKVQTLPELKEKLGSNAKVWWYQSCNSHGCTGGPTADAEVELAYDDWASYMIDHPALSNRAMGPLAFLVGIGGELYFDTVAAYQAKSPWVELFQFGGNGDGTFFYPATPSLGAKRDAPVESLRLKHLRDGLEDFEYLTLLSREGQDGLAKSLVRRWVRSGYELTLDPTQWAGVRSDAAAALKKRFESKDGLPTSNRP